MIRIDENALICDMAETYHIYDCRALPARLFAIYAVGLGRDSRIKRKILNQQCTDELMLQAMAVDCLRTLVWFQTKDGQKGKNRPPSVLDSLMEKPEEKAEKQVRGFTSGAEFEMYRKRLIESR